MKAPASRLLKRGDAGAVYLLPAYRLRRSRRALRFLLPIFRRRRGLAMFSGSFQGWGESGAI